MLNCAVENTTADEEYVVDLKSKLARAVQLGDQTEINRAFFVASLSYHIPLEDRSQLIGEAMNLLKAISMTSAKEASAYIKGVPVAALGGA